MADPAYTSLIIIYTMTTQRLLILMGCKINTYNLLHLSVYGLLFVEQYLRPVLLLYIIMPFLPQIDQNDKFSGVALSRIQTLSCVVIKTNERYNLFC